MPLMLRVSCSSASTLTHRSLLSNAPASPAARSGALPEASGRQPLVVAMGCAGSTPKVDENSKKLRKPKPWKHTQAITLAQLKQMRDEFWDTAPHYGGQKEIWDALRAATEADITLAQAIVDSAGIIVSNPDLTLCYDERGAKYELPKYVLSEPTNLIRDG